MRLFRRKKHSVAVYETQPMPGDANQVPSYTAICECGWTGIPRGSSDQALDDARAHDPNASGTVTTLGRPADSGP
jgi:hypothetical protein